MKSKSHMACKAVHMNLVEQVGHTQPQAKRNNPILKKSYYCIIVTCASCSISIVSIIAFTSERPNCVITHCIVITAVRIRVTFINICKMKDDLHIVVVRRPVNSQAFFLDGLKVMLFSCEPIVPKDPYPRADFW